MTKSPKLLAKTTSTVPSVSRAVFLLGMTFLDTTWRVFVPTIGGTILGVVLDRMFNVAPIMTIIMIILGVVVSTLLIIQQIRSLRKAV
jgi:hypothetical protein